MIIDFHIHVGSYSPQYPWVMEWASREVPGGDAREYLARYLSPEGMTGLLREHGVDYGVILAEANPLATGGVNNEDVAALCAGQPALIPWGVVNPFLVNDLPAELDRLLDDLGMRGLGLYPGYQHFYPNDARLYPLYARAEERGVPVMFHTGSSIFRGTRLKYANPLLLDDVAADFPDLPIIMAHSGRGVWYDEAFLVARLHERVYMEVSGLPPHKLLEYFPQLERIAHRTLFGSDWPGVIGISRNIEAVRALPISERAKSAILGGAAAALLGIA